MADTSSNTDNYVAEYRDRNLWYLCVSGTNINKHYCRKYESIKEASAAYQKHVNEYPYVNESCRNLIQIDRSIPELVHTSHLKEHIKRNISAKIIE